MQDVKLALLTTCWLIFFPGATGSHKQSVTKMITFNAALQDTLSMKAERREALLKGVKASGADVVCLQEVFDNYDIKLLMMGLLEKYMYSFSFIHQTFNHLKKGNDPPCKNPEFSELLTCISSKCADFDTSSEEGKLAFYVCLQQECGRLVLSLSQECLTCVFIRMDINEARDLCYLNSTTMINVPGLLLFSKREIQSASAVEYHQNVKEIAKRGYLQVNIESIGMVVCTHLSTPFLGKLYPEAFLPYGDYTTQNMAEVMKLLAAVKDITPLVLAGDFNSGPTLPECDVCAEIPESYSILTSTESRLLDSPISKCTFCNGNTWVRQDCSSSIDHIFLRGHTLKCTTRIFDDPYVEKRHHISDHYGVMVTFN